MFQLGLVVCLMFAGACATTPRHSVISSGLELPADVTMTTNVLRDGWLFFNLRMESGEGVPFMVDTGAARTLLDVSFEPKLGNRLGTAKINHFGARYEGGIYMAPRLFLGNTPLVTASNIWTYDFKHVNTSRAGQQLVGLLGFDCLRNYCIQLDFTAGKIRFLDPDHLPLKELGKAYPIIISNPGGRPFIHHVGLAGGTSTNCLIDTGCNYDGRVEKGTVKGNDSGWARMPECNWDDQTYTNLNLQVGEHANLLGLRFLARHLVTLDFPHRILYLKQTSLGPLKKL